MERSVVISCGVGLATGSVPWNTSTARRNKVDWLPTAQHAIGTCPHCKTKIPPDPVWYRFFREMAEIRMGGIQGKSVAQVATTVSQTQAQVLDNTTYTDQLVQYARSVAATAEAVKQVAQDNGLSGASSIPPPSTPPTKPASGSNAL